ncbi:molybdate ABC transporter substrate-binding protein [Kangiella koreensis]|uniref:Molybdenum ABC transporter, periplasmic molybdate-binding protein n=1 Tax=Kangiella koreensis (strain DSM 16069 / JCM 12317 / KCTC 12182 / SW-125) TaxID=523791 RepID=C7RBV8_KANKD|nr:molybdate ABC transporter substrate-binding protein [Kangiella koreensis]ACV26750.1 molybdenum ABC transporter, periplasmic molybdate-binding protein [Kangiella koreensis DSM 16069]
MIRLATIFLALNTAAAQAETISVAVPANFLKPMQVIAERYELKSGNSIILHSGSSGQLYAQAINGAPFDVFLSADEERVDALLKDNRAEQAELYTCGKLAFYSQQHQITNIQELNQLTRIAIAKPNLAPYGKAAESTLSHIQQDFSAKLIYGQNVVATYQYAMHNAVDGSFVAYSNVLKPDSGYVWLVPKELYAPIKQKMAVLTSSKKQHSAQYLYRYILSDEIQSLISEMGYTHIKDC